VIRRLIFFPPVASPIPALTVFFQHSPLFSFLPPLFCGEDDGPEQHFLCLRRYRPEAKSYDGHVPSFPPFFPPLLTLCRKRLVGIQARLPLFFFLSSSGAVVLHGDDRPPPPSFFSSPPPFSGGDRGGHPRFSLFSPCALSETKGFGRKQFSFPPVPFVFLSHRRGDENRLTGNKQPFFFPSCHSGTPRRVRNPPLFSFFFFFFRFRYHGGGSLGQVSELNLLPFLIRRGARRELLKFFLRSLSPFPSSSTSPAPRPGDPRPNYQKPPGDFPQPSFPPKIIIGRKILGFDGAAGHSLFPFFFFSTFRGHRNSIIIVYMGDSRLFFIPIFFPRLVQDVVIGGGRCFSFFFPMY